MNDAPSDPQPAGGVGLVISEIVRPDRIEEYQAWSAGICAAARKAPGFRARQVVEPRSRDRPEYLIILKFDTAENLNRWHASDEYRHWIDLCTGFIEERTHHTPCEGVELWFASPEPTERTPPAWKLIATSVLAVYPSIILLRWVTTPVLSPLNLHPDLDLFISVCLLSVLLTWPIMPTLTRWLHPWLHAGR